LGVPERTIQQRMDALANANVIRVRRAQLKRDLKARRVSVCDVLADPPAWVETMKVFDLLLAVPKIGRTKANKTLQGCVISPSKTVGGLSPRQRGVLLAALGRTGRGRDARRVARDAGHGGVPLRRGRPGVRVPVLAAARADVGAVLPGLRAAGGPRCLSASSLRCRTRVRATGGSCAAT
jgi:hypothetical protein